MKAASSHNIHLSIAETGKLLALKGKHAEALKHYREALRLAVSSRAPEVFFRHYTQCVLESLELTQAFEEVIEFCVNADEHYASLNLNTQLHKRDHGSILERLGLVYLKLQNLEAGRAALEKAQNIAGEKTLPITEEILGWLKRGYHVDISRILSSQKKYDYFVVRADQVDEKRAKPFPAMQQTGLFESQNIL